MNDGRGSRRIDSSGRRRRSRPVPDWVWRRCSPPNRTSRSWRRRPVAGWACAWRTELRPDVVLMDLRMPDLEGPEATREILERDPSTRVVVLTVVSDDADVAAAMEAGACGFLAKDTPIDGVVVAVRAAAQGAAWLSPRAAEVVLGRLRQDGGGAAAGARAGRRALARETRRAAPDRARDGERRDRRDPQHQPANRQEPRLEHPRQARSPEPRAGGDLRGPARARLSASPSPGAALAVHESAREHPGPSSRGRPQLRDRLAERSIACWIGRRQVLRRVRSRRLRARSDSSVISASQLASSAVWTCRPCLRVCADASWCGS